jgi:hypothetical protein
MIKNKSSVAANSLLEFGNNRFRRVRNCCNIDLYLNQHLFCNNHVYDTNRSQFHERHQSHSRGLRSPARRVSLGRRTLEDQRIETILWRIPHHSDVSNIFVIFDVVVVNVVDVVVSVVVVDVVVSVVNSVIVVDVGVVVVDDDSVVVVVVVVDVVVVNNCFKFGMVQMEFYLNTATTFMFVLYVVLAFFEQAMLIKCLNKNLKETFTSQFFVSIVVLDLLLRINIK